MLKSTQNSVTNYQLIQLHLLNQYKATSNLIVYVLHYVCSLLGLMYKTSD